MTKIVKNESGFGTIEVFLLLVIAAVMVFMGVYVLRANKTVKIPASSSAPTSTVTPAQNTTQIKPSTTPTDQTIQKITYDNSGTTEQLEIKKRLYDFYTAWNQLSSNAEQFSAKATPTNEAYLTKAGQQQQAAETSYNLFTCSQMKLQSLAIGEPVITTSGTSVTLTPTEIGTSTPRKPIKLTLLKQNSKWFIDHVTCSF